jgi:hypothetical protein
MDSFLDLDFPESEILGKRKATSQILRSCTAGPEEPPLPSCFAFSWRSANACGYGTTRRIALVRNAAGTSPAVWFGEESRKVPLTRVWPFGNGMIGHLWASMMWGWGRRQCVLWLLSFCQT